MRLKPVNDKIVVKPTETEELKTTDAGIILPDTAADGGLCNVIIILLPSSFSTLNLLILLPSIILLLVT